MATIALEGMKFRAFHGFYEEEQILGGDYVVDVLVTTGIDKAAIGDDLEKTINYETIYLICESAMRKNSKLLETVAERIAMGIRHQFKYIKEMKVKVKKLNPPLGGRVESAWVEVDGSYSKRCGRCGRPMLCYGDKTCWCLDLDKRVYGKTLEQIKVHFGNQCLCKECLDYYAG
ncbi:MAG: dihydroneopterin aldolase [Lewinellaceae bacterium]|nr:dihydroneopterin aldolase [Saprospiraceae bacterium]MCB9338718.1 dihydroneopterin aldolase [Lewinellaceae bacterium]